MVLVSGEATTFGLSIVDVSGGAAIRDDISLTARRTTLDKIFQTKLFRCNGDSHAHAHAHAYAYTYTYTVHTLQFHLHLHLNFHLHIHHHSLR